MGGEEEELRGQGIEHPGQRAGIAAAPKLQEVLLDDGGHPLLISRGGWICSENSFRFARMGDPGAWAIRGAFRYVARLHAHADTERDYSTKVSRPCD